jgi:integrase
MFRHSVAMSMYKNAIPISYIKDFLGHADLSTTSVYSYADNETIRKALESVQDEIPTSLPKNKKWKGKEEDLMKYCCID